jgi:hypothetical protein
LFGIEYFWDQSERLYEVWRAELPFNPRAVLAEATKYLEWISHLDPETVDDEIVQQATIDLVGQIIERAYKRLP